MPDLLVVVAAIMAPIIFIAFLSTFLQYNKNTKLWWIYLISILIGFLILWVILYAKQDWRYIKHSTSIETAFEQDMFQYDGCIYNANRLFGKNFEDGQKIDILVRDGGLYYGILPIRADINKFKLVTNE